MTFGQSDKGDGAGFGIRAVARCVDHLYRVGQCLRCAGSDRDCLPVEGRGCCAATEADNHAIVRITKVGSVVARATNQGVIACAAAQHVIPGVAVDGIVARAARHEFIGRATAHRISPRRARCVLEQIDA